MQQELLPEMEPPLRMKVGLTALDLFSGIGGLSLGFRDAGFSVKGVDNEAVAGEVYRHCAIGDFVQADLRLASVPGNVDVIIGGPPCRPWAAINQQRRRARHDDHALLDRFFDHVLGLRPWAFLMENVPALGSDDSYYRHVKAVQRTGYSIQARPVRYSDYGAATSRSRLFTIGFRSTSIDASEFFARLDKRRKAPLTVGDAIGWLRNEARDAVPDHDWSELSSIGNYADRYASGRYGWKQLEYDQPAPSFGSIAKTYILHPEAGRDGFPMRVLSVREAMAIMGLGSTIVFPRGTARAQRYQMVANSVSPIVSRLAACVIREILTGSSGE